jgi:MSHA biogenesis protein MshG
MPMFSYKGRTLRGELVTGRIDGDTADAVASRLFTSGITPIDISAAASAQDLSVDKLGRMIGLGQPRISDLVLFTRQMYTITKSGLPLLRGLRGLSASTHNPVLRDALEDVLSSLEAGRDLATSFARHPKIFPTLYVSIVRVGEQTGTLEKSFQRLGEYLQQDQDMQDRMKSAMRYPIIVLAAIAIAIGILTAFVIPRFAPIFAALGDDIPMPTRIIMGTSTFVRDQWYVVLATLAVIVFATRAYIGTDTGRYRWHKFKLKLPVIGKLTHEAILSRICRSLAISLSAGMSMSQTLAVIARSSGNDYMAEQILRLRDCVERGDSLSRASTTVGMFPPLVLQMMAVGEETGELSTLLDEVAGFYEREVDYALKNLTSAIEPLLIIAVGGMVLILALGVFLPLWNMISKVGGMH